MPYAQITGWGMHVPARVVPNQRFVEMGLNTSSEWITTRTGIEQRHLVKDEPTSELAVKAARLALHVADVHPKELDLILLATCTPDHIMPATASIVQDRLGAANAGALDVNAACAGFVYALTLGAGQLESGRAENILVIGADELSVHLDWRDRGTCVLFGDGAGAVVLQRADEPGIMSSTTGSDGAGAGLLHIRGNRRRRPGANGHSPNGDDYLRMNGPQIFRWATQMMSRAADKVIAASGLRPDQVDLLIPHQANARIMDSTARRIGLPPEKVFSNVRKYGNTSAASIPIALCDAIAAGRIKGGDNIVLSSFGAGLSWAAVALRWGVNVPAEMPRWHPIRHQLEAGLSALRSTVRRQEWAVRARIDKLRREQP